MCFFKGMKVELFPEAPEHCSDYWRNGESDAEHRKRMQSALRERAEQNRRLNSSKEPLTIPVGRSVSETSYRAGSGEFTNKALKS